MNPGHFDLSKIIEKLSKKRPIFVSEADFQLELALAIKETLKNARVRLEYCPKFDPNMHIDILVIIDGKWYPIELKYRTKECEKTFDNEFFRLKNHSAKDIGCYAYLKDIQRIENIRANAPEFAEGYTIFITNELSYAKAPASNNCAYRAFSLEESAVKSGVLHWQAGSKTGEGRMVSSPIMLQDSYPIHWQEYSKLDDTTTGKFIYLKNVIKHA